MACVTKRRGKWILDYRDAHGKRHWETTDLSKKEAQLLLAQRLQEIHRGEYQAKREERTFDGLAEAYLAGHVRVNVRATTAKDYEGNLKLHIRPYFTGRRIRHITPEQVEQFRAYLLENGVGRRTVNKCLTLLSMMFRYALRHRWISYNPAADVKKLRDPAIKHDQVEDSILQPEEIKRLLKAADERYRVLFLTAILTGLRQGELLGLQWGDIDWNGKQLHVRRQFTHGRFSELKTKSSRRRVGLSEELIGELKKWKLRCPKGGHDLIFPTGTGNPESHSNLMSRGFYPALRRAGLRRIRFHDLRHTFASFLVAKNVHPKRIQSLLGHSSITITMDVYGHLMDETDNEAAEHIADLVFGSKVVARKKKGLRRETQVLESYGGPGRTRTYDQRIMSPRL